MSAATRSGAAVEAARPGDRLIMDGDDVERILTGAQNTKLVVVDLKAMSHCGHTRRSRAPVSAAVSRSRPRVNVRRGIADRP
jgi:hypothetical protein